MTAEPPTTKGRRLEQEQDSVHSGLGELRARMRSDWPALPSDDEIQQQPSILNATIYAHDGPHDAAKIEWWYINAHFGDDDRYSVFAAFFRLAIDGTKGTCAYAANWALVDSKEGTYQTSSLLDPGTPAILGAMIDTNEYQGDPFVLKALKEMFGAGRVLEPDRVMQDVAIVSAVGEALHLNFGGNVFRTVSTEGNVPTYELALVDSVTGTSLQLSLRPRCPPALSGKRGVVETGRWQDDMFYYFTPLCDVLGGAFVKQTGAPAVTIPGGSAWIDHEFGGCAAHTFEEVAVLRNSNQQHSVADYSWEWVAVQLQNETKDAVSVTLLRDMKKEGAAQLIGLFAMYQIGVTGAFYRYEDGVSMRSSAARWASKVTGMQFPTQWTVTIPHKGGVTLTLDAAVQAQEFVTIPGKPSYWEGRVKVSGTVTNDNGVLVPTTGLGFVECHGEKNLTDVAAIYGIMHMMLCTPMEHLQIPNSSAASVVNLLTALPLALPTVQQAAMMAQMTSGKPMPPRHKELLQYLLAVYLVAQHSGESPQPHTDESRSAVTAALDALRERWEAVPSWDFPTLVLRAFTLRTLDHLGANQLKWFHEAASQSNAATSEAPAVSPAAVVSFLNHNEAEWLAVPSDEELNTPATDAVLMALDALARGTWAIDASKPRGNIGDFLGAQGVGFIARNLCASVTPDLKSSTNLATKTLETDIITALSTTKSIVQLNGQPWKWESFGRGTITSRGSCKVSADGKVCVLVVVSPVANQELEVKWVIVRDDSTMQEVLHLLPANGGQPRATFSQWFKRK